MSEAIVDRKGRVWDVCHSATIEDEAIMALGAFYSDFDISAFAHRLEREGLYRVDDHGRVLCLRSLNDKGKKQFDIEMQFFSLACEYAYDQW